MDTALTDINPLLQLQQKAARVGSYPFNGLTRRSHGISYNHPDLLYFKIPVFMVCLGCVER